ncbi:uncharacterized protein TORIP [Euwallacea fornicatus]|uniref:uncharacterized protein TORIP n=1 Tax=Euwallacea fornicatus TaxID=995702 RepID=UPI0033905CB5
MGIDRPEASSTPTTVCRLKGRKGVHDESSIESPISCVDMNNWHEYSTYSTPRDIKSLNGFPVTTSVRNKVLLSQDLEDCEKKNESDILEEDDSDILEEDDSDISQDSNYLNQSKSFQQEKNISHTETAPYKIYLKKMFSPTTIIICIISITLLYSVSKGNSEPNKTIKKNLINTFKSMEEKFIHQDEDFWRRIRVNIEEIRNKQKPSTIIFLYENNYKGESTMQRILNYVKDAAVCYLTDCDNDAIVIHGSALNLEIIEDYGKVISKYRDPLETSGVMIVEHLEEVPGKVAQSFHHFCDEHNPLVSNALMLFTVKVDKLPDDKESDSYLRKTLTLLWNDIGRDDKFEPLYARMSGTVLVVRPE